MNTFHKVCLSLLMAIFTLTTFISCKESSKTMLLPAGGGGGSALSGSALLINALTEALNDISVNYAFNNAGYGIALWYSTSGNGDRYLYSVYNPSQNKWSIAQEFCRNISAPRVASNGTGFMAVFTHNNNVYASPWTSGAFGDPVKITTVTSECINPTITSDGTGYCAAWRQHTIGPNHHDVYAARYSGTAWGAPAALDTTDQTPGNIQIVSGGSGYCVSWYENDTDRTFASVYNGSWSAAQNVGNDDAMDSYHIAGNDAGLYMIIFCDNSDSNYSIYARLFNGSWGAVEPLEALTGYASSPHVASNGTTFCAVWQQYDTSYYNIYAKQYSAGWQATELLETADNNVYEPVIASDNAGYCAVWYQHDGSTWKTHARRYASTSWQPVEILNPATTGNTQAPYLSSNGAGYMAYWVEDDITSHPDARYILYTSVFAGGSWSAPVSIASDEYSIYYPGAIPFTAGYALTCGTYGDASNRLLANVNRNGEWGGTLDIAAGQRHGSCSRPSDVPLLYKAGDETVAIWRQYNSNGNSGELRILASVKTGSKWGSPVLLAEDINSVHYAASSGSSVCVVWNEYVSSKSRHVITSKIYSNGAWSADTVLDNDTNGNYSYDPRVAGNGSSSDFCVTWYQYDGSAYYRVYANLHTASGWSGPVQIDNAGMSAESNLSHIVAGTTGYCVAFFQDSQTYGTVYNGSSWTSPNQLHTSIVYPSRLTMAGSGDKYAITQELSGNVCTNVYDGSSWSGNVMDVQDRVPANYASNPTVTGDGQGGFCLAWMENADSAYYNITARIYDGSSLSWGDAENTEVPEIFDIDAYSFYPRVASNGTGYAVTYRKQDEYGSYSLYTSVHDGSYWLGGELLENNITDVESYYYDINSNGAGYGVAWCQYDSASNMMAYGSVYDDGEWESRPLSNGEGDVNNVEVLGSGSSYTAAWFQVDSVDNIVQNIWVNTFN